MKREAFQEVSILHLMSHGEPVSTTQVRPYFYVTDYLGSVRMVCDGITGEVRQSLEYLPSGYVFRSDNYAEQPYMFCGKELVKMHGINLYDSNARFQHKDLPRFTQMDPLAEKYYSLSPYNYAGNDPVNAADPSGLGWIRGDYEGFTFYFYDRRVNTLEDFSRFYSNVDHTLSFLGDSGFFQVDGVRYDLLADGSIISDYNTITEECFWGDDNSGIIVGSDKFTNLDNWSHNLYGRYLGAGNPYLRDGNYSYAMPPISYLDYAAWKHDRAYDKVGAEGPWDALFNTSTFNADLKLSIDSLKALSGESSANSLMSFLTFRLFSRIVVFKFFLQFLK